MLTKLFLAPRAIKTAVGADRKSLRVELIGYFPSKQENESASEKTVCINVGNKHQGREHHGEIPIVNSAGGTATVFHKPGLKRAEEQNADYIAYRKSKCNENKYATVNDPKEIKRSDEPV